MRTTHALHRSTHGLIHQPRPTVRMAILNRGGVATSSVDIQCEVMFPTTKLGAASTNAAASVITIALAAIVALLAC